MGEVYRARDEKLNRDVAIKVLPASFSQDADRLRRFEQEAQAAGTLNHPNILAVYDVGTHDGAPYVVSELLEGETLRERLSRPPIPQRKAVDYATQIARGLAAAHARNIVHRDLKPENIFIAGDGQVKILDFGLAKLIEPVGAGPMLTDLPTRKLNTTPGVVMGTLGYMSPEQVDGKAVDYRSDIFSFGAVLYEMLAGRRAFPQRETLRETLHAIAAEDPPLLSELVPHLSPSLEKLVERCLEKRPEDRFQSTRDLAFALEALSGASTTSHPELSTTPNLDLSTSPAVAVPARARAQLAWQNVLPWMLVVLLAAGLALMYVLRAPKTQSLVRSSISLPRGFSLDTNNSSLALSPDGRRLVFAAAGDDGKGQQLWLRSMDSLTIQPVAGTIGATYPFWSPDCRHVGFFADQKLKKTEISSGLVQILCDAVEGRGASWSRQDIIVFAPQAFGSLFEVAAAGGTPVQVTSVESNDVTHRLPHFLPDGERLLFFSGKTAAGEKEKGIYSLDLKTKKVALVARESSEGIYVEPGYLVFVRNGNLMAQSFDDRGLRLTGQAVPIAEHVFYNPDRFTGAYALSDTGLFVFDGGSGVAKSQLTWFEVGGTKLGTVGEPAAFVSISISPDGRRALATIQGNAPQSLWMYDLSRGSASRFTTGSEGFSTPAWSPDGRLVVYTGQNRYLYLQASDAISEAQKLQTGQISTAPSSWSPDGRMIVFASQTSQGGDLWIQSLEGDKKSYPFLVTPANEIEGTISPDGRWIAFASDETGRYELYVTSFPSPGGKRQISSDGADTPQWLNAGRELAYINAQRKLVVVDVKARGQEFEIGQSQVLFAGKPLPGRPSGPDDWAVPVYLTSDGKRILLPVPMETDSSPPLTLVTNWTTALKK
jgi:serine/threonine protein kinase